MRPYYRSLAHKEFVERLGLSKVVWQRRYEPMTIKEGAGGRWQE